jgi:acetyltransferase
MDVHKLDQILNPKRIALIGVTTNPKSVGGKVLTNLVGSGFRGVVYPVNPQAEAVMGIQCYPDVKSLPNKPGLAVICTAAEKVPEIIKECGEAGILGIIIPSLNLNISFAPGMPKAGHVAFISQSGALCSSVLDWALEEKIGFSYFVSIGNAIDVDFGDPIDYFGEDEKSKSINLYIESINNARMINVFRKRGFDIKSPDKGSLVEVSKRLGSQNEPD